MSEWGNPPGAMSRYSVVSKVATRGGTKGTETSKYLQEEKETSIFQVAASERERGQTRCLHLGFRTCKGVRSIAEDDWKVTAKRVKHPYAKCEVPGRDPE